MKFVHFKINFRKGTKFYNLSSRFIYFFLLYFIYRNEEVEDFDSANLFEDLDELQTMVLSPDDPYYEVKKERVIEKVIV